jgi:hypothetical protein
MLRQVAAGLERYVDLRCSSTMHLPKTLKIGQSPTGPNQNRP